MYIRHAGVTTDAHDDVTSLAGKFVRSRRGVDITGGLCPGEGKLDTKFG